MEELSEALKLRSLDKAPGVNGFWKILNEDMFEVYKASFENEE